jgi:hypothetical protein
VKLANRILLAVATLLAKLVGLDELLDAVVLPFLLLEHYRLLLSGHGVGRRGVSDGATASRLSGAPTHHRPRRS